MRTPVLFGAALCVAGWLSACGGKVVVESTSGAGGGSGPTTAEAGSTSGVGGGSTSCAGRDHLACLGAYPTCVPVYDDACCSMCDPTGGCADCINIQFHHCIDKGSACGPSGPPCGQTPAWACSGGQAECAVDPGGSTTPCASVAGCIPAFCPTDVTCKTDPICEPAKATMCAATCGSIPHPCPAGTAPETDGSCYTGACIPDTLCPKPF
ncbi:MAG: hypothetical protein ABJE95_02740 [Byssovorax sp.]